jgi:hypothetical protein
LLSGGVLVENRLTYHPAGRQLQPNLLVGKKLVLDGQRWDQSPTSAVLFISSHCHFCEESVPFYRRIAQLRDRESPGFSLVVLTRDTRTDMTGFLERKALVVSGIYDVPSGFADLAGTPTILIVDASGIVRQVFLGKLSPADEEKVLKILETGKS